MYLGVWVVLALIVAFLSPALWLAWWFVAGMGERASGPETQRAGSPIRYRPA